MATAAGKHITRQTQRHAADVINSYPIQSIHLMDFRSNVQLINQKSYHSHIVSVYLLDLCVPKSKFTLCIFINHLALFTAALCLHFTSPAFCFCSPGYFPLSFTKGHEVATAGTNCAICHKFLINPAWADTITSVPFEECCHSQRAKCIKALFLTNVTRTLVQEHFNYCRANHE